MRILMLGNSFTYYHDMPVTLGNLLGADVTAHTRGGARLSEQFNPETEMGARTLRALRTEQWDYVVMQEQSNGAITSPDKFFHSVATLCSLIRQNGAIPVLYATWAYRDEAHIQKMMGISRAEMAHQLHTQYNKAAQENRALIAPVGLRFQDGDPAILYEADGCHPSELGSRWAAETLADVIRTDFDRRKKVETV